MGAGRSPYRAQVYTVYAVPSVLACNLYMDVCALPQVMIMFEGGNGVVEMCVRQGMCDL